MREVKFRAWDKVDKIWLAFDGKDPIGFDYTMINNGGWAIFFDYDEDRVSLMQYTGLLDKNEKEIYEGDIVQWASGRRCKVYWFSSLAYSGWDLKVLNSEGKPNEEHHLWEELEIVGNIYENPELLVVK